MMIFYCTKGFDMSSQDPLKFFINTKRTYLVVLTLVPGDLTSTVRKQNSSSFGH
jgi:hypothetical protein